MNTFYRTSGLGTKLITTALLAVFVMGFGAFASVQVESRASSCSLQQSRQHSKEYCSVELIMTAMDHGTPATFCQCQETKLLAYK